MLIFIPSKGRANSVKTLASMPESRVASTRLVVPSEEYSEYCVYFDKKMVLATEAKGIANTRQWVLENSKDNYAMFMDDDMDFHWRDNNLKLHKAGHQEVEKMLQQIESWLKDGFVHVGVSQRAGNNRQEEPFVDIARMNNTYAYNIKETLKAGGRFDRLQVMEDFDMTLILLKAGLPNRVSYEYSWSQGKSGAAGGCSTYRNFEMQKKAAFQLAQLHPGLVKVHGKQSKSNWENIGDTRADVIISWKKAYQPKKPANNIGIKKFF